MPRGLAIVPTHMYERRHVRLAQDLGDPTWTNGVGSLVGSAGSKTRAAIVHKFNRKDSPMRVLLLVDR